MISTRISIRLGYVQFNNIKFLFCYCFGLSLENLQFLIRFCRRWCSRDDHHKSQLIKETLSHC